MSLEPILWAMKHAPVADAGEWSVLVAMAESADEDGCNAYRSRQTIGDTVKMDPKTVGRRQAAMEKRGLIARGDQSVASYIRADVRPVVWDLLIPFDWFPDIEKTNARRVRQGRKPLVPCDRPPMTDAPAKKKRRDVGVPRPERRKNAGTASPTVNAGTTSPTGTTSPPTQGLQVPNEGSRSPTTLPSTHPNNSHTPQPPGTELEVADTKLRTAAVATRITRSKPKTYMTEDWLPPVDAADQMCAELGVNRNQLAVWLPEFRDYWIGLGKPMADWTATWRNRMRDLARRGEQMPGAAPGGRSNDPAMDVLRRDLAAHEAAAQTVEGAVL